MPIDDMRCYARIGIYYSICRNSLCNYTHNFKISFLNKNCAVALTKFYQYFLLWLGKFLRNSYLLLNLFNLLCAKDVYRCFYRKLTAVLYMSDQRKLMTLVLIVFQIICSGDIETNPGPKKNTKISFCHWNLNRIAAYNFCKLSLLQAVVPIHEYDIMSVGNFS